MSWNCQSQARQANRKSKLKYKLHTLLGCCAWLWQFQDMSWNCQSQARQANRKSKLKYKLHTLLGCCAWLWQFQDMSWNCQSQAQQTKRKSKLKVQTTSWWENKKSGAAGTAIVDLFSPKNWAALPSFLPFCSVEILWQWKSKKSKAVSRGFSHIVRFSWHRPNKHVGLAISLVPYIISLDWNFSLMIHYILKCRRTTFIYGHLCQHMFFICFKNI